MTNAADSIYTARATLAEITEKQLQASVTPLGANPTTGHIKRYLTEVGQVLQVIPNLQDPTNGYKRLLDASTLSNPIPIVDLTSASMTTADALIASTDTADAAFTTSNRSDAEDEALKRNLGQQRVLGSKDGVVNHCVKAAGRKLTGTITHRPDGGRKSNDQFQLEALFAHMLTATQSETWRALQKVAGNLVQAKFNLTETFQSNVQSLRLMVERLDAAGIEVTPSMVVLVVLGNLERASAQPWGATLLPALQTINTDHPSGTKHDDSTLQTILATIAKQDAQRNLSSAPNDTSLADLANEVESLSDDPDVAAEATESAVKSRRKQKTKPRGRSRSKDRHDSRSQAQKVADNPCPHCRKFKRWGTHPHTPPSKCFFNKAYKGWRGDTAIRMLNERYPDLKLKFKERSKFTPDLGGTKREADDDESASFVSSEASVMSLE